VNQTGLYPADDAVAAAFQFESGVVGTGSWCFTIPEKQESDVTEIIGTKGRISFSFFSNNVIHVETETMVENFEIAKPEHVHQPLVELVVRDLRGEDTCPSTGETGMRASMWMDKITMK
jgi:predicted dehydrogenase